MKTYTLINFSLLLYACYRWVKAERIILLQKSREEKKAESMSNPELWKALRHHKDTYLEIENEINKRKREL